MKKIKILWLFLILILVGIFAASRSALAGSAVLYLAPASGNVSRGDTLSIQIKVNSGTEPVNAVQANLSYPNNMLDYVGVDNSSSFSVVAQTENKGGNLKIARGTLPPSVSGVQTVATVKFKVKKDSGTIGIQFTSGSAVAKDDGKGTNILSGTVAGNYTVGATAAASSNTSTTSVAGTPPAPTADSVTVSGQTTSTTPDQPVSTAQGKPLTLKGVTIPNGIVNLYVYSEPKKYTTVADKDGNWTFTITDLPAGSHHVEIEVTDPITQKTSERKKLFDLTVAPAAASALSNSRIPKWYALVAALLAGTAGAVIYHFVHNRRVHAGTPVSAVDVPRTSGKPPQSSKTQL